MGNAAIVLAGGSGSRMKSKTKKQYLLLGDYPVLWYSINVFQKSPLIDEIVLVCPAGEEEQCRRQYVEEYGFSKIRKITEGGSERYHSVYQGLRQLEECDYVLIHDGARPFIDEPMLERIFECLGSCPACVVGMPVKDTIKMRNDEGYVEQTLPRERLWMIQTPQAFSYPLIWQAYEELMRREQKDSEKNASEQRNEKQNFPEKANRENVNADKKSREIANQNRQSLEMASQNRQSLEMANQNRQNPEIANQNRQNLEIANQNRQSLAIAQKPATTVTKITDDAMVVETMLGLPVKLIEGSYDNIKITTPEDLPLARTLFERYI